MAELDRMEIFRRLNRRPQKTEALDDLITIFPQENKPSNYFEVRVAKERPAGGKFKYLTFKIPHQMPPGFPFHDIPTSMMVADAPMIQCLRQFGLMHMMNHVPLAREYFGSMRKRGLGVWAR